ncbi:MAG: 16S rRNA (cytidine(1402)-2'-O)-methyltransferase, partial [Acidimicrobiia bacterium]
ALVASGLPTGRYAFEGFLPRKGSGRANRLAELAAERRTVVLYEAPHRLVRTLADLAEACGPDRRVAIGRELTKLHEETWRGTLVEAVAWAEARPPRGELVVVLAGAPAPEVASAADVTAAVQARLDAGDSARDAAAAVARALGVPKRSAYDVAVRLARA